MTIEQQIVRASASAAWQTGLKPMGTHRFYEQESSSCMTFNSERKTQTADVT